MKWQRINILIYMRLIGIFRVADGTCLFLIFVWFLGESVLFAGLEGVLTCN